MIYDCNLQNRQISARVAARQVFFLSPIVPSSDGAAPGPSCKSPFQFQIPLTKVVCHTYGKVRAI